MKNFKLKGFIFILFTFIPSIVSASGTGMPWEGPMDQVLNSITGPWLQFGSIASIVIAGLTLAIGETGGLMKKAMSLVLGLSIACAATGWGINFFGFSGGIITG